MVRHFRLGDRARTAVVSHVSLPPDADEAGRFVREAVKAYPELYFARFVILGEGSSEEVVLPRLAEAMGLDIDRSFAAVVPLGDGTSTISGSCSAISASRTRRCWIWISAGPGAAGAASPKPVGS